MDTNIAPVSVTECRNVPVISFFTVRMETDNGEDAVSLVAVGYNSCDLFTFL